MTLSKIMSHSLIPIAECHLTILCTIIQTEKHLFILLYNKWHSIQSVAQENIRTLPVAKMSMDSEQTAPRASVSHSKLRERFQRDLNRISEWTPSYCFRRNCADKLGVERCRNLRIEFLEASPKQRNRSSWVCGLPCQRQENCQSKQIFRKCNQKHLQ